MNEVSNLVKADKIIRWGMTASFALLILQAAMIALFYQTLPPVVPIYNQLPWGDERLGAKFELLLPLIITAVYFLFNYLLLKKLYPTMPLVSRILGITTFLSALLSCIFVARTLQLTL